ncbi:HET-domain-containing protein [Acrodontium crateriforme]|uniref:HET-domain-containing protein n=1 Tax=Acrodontium crateriforme TaxID=150365 RepID=A0AAQ3RCS5_9PEZI|nr:HET-domain-containing protein [Acrodontium crateriforme]
MWKMVFWLWSMILPIWDGFDLMEATIVERIPKALQRWFSRYQQNQKARKVLPAYQHAPLLPGKIRLMRLKSQSRIFPSVVEAELFEASVESVPSYEAVSYRWGSSERTDEIVLNGKRFAVTKSALELLLARRSIWRERTLWIDAICIDQANEEEKTIQVRMMKDIYSLAERVVAFPGGDWTARVAAPLIIEIFGYEFSTQRTSLQNSEIWRREGRSIKWQTMIDLFTNEYFNRGWMIQEIAVAKKVELYYGNMYIPWSLFSRVIDTIMVPHRSNELMISKERGQSRLIKASTLENIGFMTSLRPTDVAEERWTLQPQFEALLMKTCSFGTADPRDRIFSLRGIAVDIEDDRLKPDYSVTPEDLFEEVARHVMFEGSHHSLHLLSIAGVGFRSDELKMPSWVPNFGETRDFVPYSEIKSLSTNYQASGDSIAVIQPGPYPGSISCKGVLCDQIKAMSRAGAFQFADGQSPQPKTVNAVHFSRVKFKFVKAAMDLISENKDLWATGFDVIKERLWLALLADRVNYLPAARLPFKDIFWHWFRYIELLNSFNNIKELHHSHFTEDVAESYVDGSIASYDWGMVFSVHGRTFAVTERGELALVPPKALPTDIIFLPYGSQVPMVIREKNEEGTYELVGEAYVQGAMMGEMMEYRSTHEMTAIFI